MLLLREMKKNYTQGQYLSSIMDREHLEEIDFIATDFIKKNGRETVSLQMLDSTKIRAESWFCERYYQELNLPNSATQITCSIYMNIL